MAKTARTADFREKILKEGLLKHRQTSLSLPRWRARYVVFKVTNSGRLQFLVYKEQPTIPANEVKEITIEEFGGLEANLKLDSEKFVFAIVTTHVTDCFATDTPEEMHEWVRLLQEYLGKEMVLNITVPFKQNLLKSGKAQLRIRNTSFTVTTCDNPPRCQGTWQIVHIRKFGGTDSFRFQTGSKCPSGEYLYTINTEDNSRIKILFNDLSQHKPIFTDDRLGRRMTIERKHRTRGTLPAPPTQTPSHMKVTNRYSLQSASSSSSSSSSSQSHIYENRPAITEMPAQVTADLVKAGVSPPMGRRHSAVDGQIFNPKTHSAIVKANGSQRTSRSIEDLTYQNIHRSSPHGGRRSPQKKISSGVMPEELPEGYYNVSPPLALKKYRLSNSSSSPPPANSPSSPEEGSPPRGSEIRRTTPPIGEEEAEYCEGYVKFSVVEGDSLVVKRSSGGSERIMNGSATSLPGQVYQNLEFMRGTSTDEGDKHRNSATPLAQLPPVPDPDLLPLYTNVEFARESVHGRTMKAGSPHRSFPKEGMQPGRRKDRSTLPSHPLPPRNTHRTTPLSPTKLTAQSRLRISHSNFELQSNNNRSSDASRSKSPPVDYYNHFVPDLPANNSLSRLTTTSQSQLERVQSPTGRDEREMSPLSLNKEGYARLARNEKLPSSHNPQLPGYASVDDMKRMVVVDDPEDAEAPEGTNSLGRYIPSYYDRLEIKSQSNSPCFSPVPTDRTISPRPGCYDTLAPIENGTSSSQKPIYGILQRLEDSKSSSSSPEPTTLPPGVIHSKAMVYQKKVALLGHGHNYESVDVGAEGVDLGDIGMLGRTSSGDERSLSPEGKEHPLDWLSPVSDTEAFSFSEQDKEGMIESAQKLRKSSKSPNTRSRRKPLPLQSVSFSKDQDDGCDETPPAIPPKRSKSPIVTSTETNVNSPKSPRKPAPLPRSVRLQSTESGSGDFLSSTEEANSSKRQSTLSTASTSSVDSDKGQSLLPERPRVPRTPSPSRGDSLESASLKPNRILSVTVETVKSNSDGDKVPSPKTRHRMITSEKSDSSDEFSPPHMVRNPPLPPRNNSAKQRDARAKETLPVSLPYTHVDFSPPIRPPKPKILAQQEQSQQQQYAVVSFNQSASPNDDMYSSVFPSVPLPSVGKNYSKSKSGSVNSDRGNYASIDHTMTRELWKMKEEVEDQRSRERKFIKDNKSS